MVAVLLVARAAREVVETQLHRCPRRVEGHRPPEFTQPAQQRGQVVVSRVEFFDQLPVRAGGGYLRQRLFRSPESLEVLLELVRGRRIPHEQLLRQPLRDFLHGIAPGKLDVRLLERLQVRHGGRSADLGHDPGHGLFRVVPVGVPHVFGDDHAVRQVDQRPGAIRVGGLHPHAVPVQVAVPVGIAVEQAPPAYEPVALVRDVVVNHERPVADGVTVGGQIPVGIAVRHRVARRPHPQQDRVVRHIRERAEVGLRGARVRLGQEDQPDTGVFGLQLLDEAMEHVGVNCRYGAETLEVFRRHQPGGIVVRQGDDPAAGIDAQPERVHQLLDVLVARGPDGVLVGRIVVRDPVGVELLQHVQSAPGQLSRDGRDGLAVPVGRIAPVGLEMDPGEVGRVDLVVQGGPQEIFHVEIDGRAPQRIPRPVFHAAGKQLKSRSGISRELLDRLGRPQRPTLVSAVQVYDPPLILSYGLDDISFGPIGRCRDSLTGNAQVNAEHQDHARGGGVQLVYGADPGGCSGQGRQVPPEVFRRDMHGLGCVGNQKIHGRCGHPPDPGHGSDRSRGRDDDDVRGHVCCCQWHQRCPVSAKTGQNWPQHFHRRCSILAGEHQAALLNNRQCTGN